MPALILTAEAIRGLCVVASYLLIAAARAGDKEVAAYLIEGAAKGLEGAGEFLGAGAAPRKLPQMLRRQIKHIEQNCGEWLNGELGAGWRNKPDASAMLEALAYVLPACLPTLDDFAKENLDHTRIVEAALKRAAAFDRKDPTFANGGLGYNVLRCLLLNTVAQLQHDRAFREWLDLSISGELLRRIDEIRAKLDVIIVQLSLLQSASLNSAQDSNDKILIHPLSGSWVYCGHENYKENGEFQFRFRVRLMYTPPFSLTALAGFLYANDGCICAQYGKPTIKIDGKSIETTSDNENFAAVPCESGDLLIEYQRDVRPPFPEEAPNDCEHGDLWIRLQISKDRKQQKSEFFFRYGNSGKPNEKGGELVPLEKLRDVKCLSDAALSRLRLANLIDDETLTELRGVEPRERYQLVNFGNHAWSEFTAGRVTREFLNLLERVKTLELDHLR